MSGADILPFGEGDGPFPPGEVLDLALSVAIGGDLARTRAELSGLVADWFLRPASDAEISASIGRLLARGQISRFGEGEFDFCLTETGIDSTTTLSGGMIRMIDRGRGLIKTSFLLQMLDLDQGKCS
ncbi:MAG: hypothetical protein V2I43_06375 [Parvularcula sp.]|jgi:hypothetical protein|nr:hypothetical protein [Parvularcula sp.]